MKTITWTTKALRSLSKLPAPARADIADKLARYAETGAGSIKAMKGKEFRGLARVRAGSYRAVFKETATEIVVVLVGDRRDIYE